MKEISSYFYVDYRSITAIISIIFFVMSIFPRYFGYKENFCKPFTVVTQMVLPIFCAVSMIIVIILFGKNNLWLSVFPLSLGVLSFIFKLFIDPRYTGILHHVACAILYSAIIILWFLTVQGTIRTPLVLTGLFVIPLLIHILGEDLPVILGKTAPISKAMWLKEASMLCLMLALTFLTISFQTV